MTARATWIIEQVNQITWTNARKVYEPHQYFLRRDHPDLYDALAAEIKEHGYDGTYFKTTYRYLALDGWKYWAYQTLVNREPVDYDERRKTEGRIPFPKDIYGDQPTGFD